MSTPQNFSNHTRKPTPILAVISVLLIGVILSIADIFMPELHLINIALALAGLASVGGFFIARIYSTALQDRIIRTEMRLRLREVIDDDLRGRIDDLTIPQLVGLRFASDAELSELTRKTLSENLSTATSIKKLVKEWVPDHHRV